ncbi:Rv2175c family DNA-binding protein [Thermasporomyces composti]|uniref:Excisionase family DNA binding protein n=1 Tax=Thermasporomyces composti TaxID=696763 RepID=A0A3D9V221_THECX|nr:Rv2175c family DNA-binding protein [Thermasporomyces composti]REF34833.1 excisionase family DNA binding protein [Thermasporomyces composti]
MSQSDSTTHAAAPDLDALVREWLTIPEVAERLHVSVSKVRQLLRDGELVAVPSARDDREALLVPAAFLDGDHVLRGLGSTLTVLHDQGYDAVEAVRWLFTPDEALDGTPIAALAHGRGRLVRRHAQVLGF